MRRPCSVAGGAVAGSVIAAVLFAVEVAARGAPFEPWGPILAIALGAGFGGCVGAVSAPLERWSWLVLMLLGPTFLLGLPRTHWALKRAFELTIHSHAQPMFTGIHVALALTAVGVTAGLSMLALDLLTARLQRRGAKALVIVAITIGCGHAALSALEMDSAQLGVWLVFLWVAVAGAALAFGKLVHVIAAIALLFSAVAIHVIPARYHVLLSTMTAFAFGFALLLTRYNLHKLLHRETTRGTWVVVGSVVVSLIAAERIVTEHPLAWRLRPQSGALTGALITLRNTTDFDGDGHGMVFGMRDCAPFDATRGPHRHETLNNGVDDNCVAGSADQTSPSFLEQIDDRERPAATAKGSDLIFYVVDALRHDDARMKNAGWAPFLDASIVYERAYTTGTFTSQAMMGHLAGRLPSTQEMVVVHRLNAYPSPVPKGLPHHLAEHGYDTGLAGGMDCDPDTDCRESAYFLPISYGDGFRVARLVERDGTTADVLRQARRAWAELDASRPRMLWIHDLSVHDAARDRADYRKRVRAASETFRTLRGEIGEDAVWVLTSDHGEEFLEHGDWRHARTLYEEVLRVPLAIHVPKQPARNIPNVCSTRSLMPTLLALLGIQVAEDRRGPFLCTEAEGCLDQPAPAALELEDLHLHALVLGHRKIIRDIGQGVLFWFDLKPDPQEQNPSFYPPDDLRGALESWEEQVFGNRDDASVWPYLPR